MALKPKNLEKSQLIKSVLLENINSLASESLAASGFECVNEDSSFSGSELLSKLSDIEVLGIRSKTKVRQIEFQELNKLKTIGCFCIGTDQVDLLEAKKHGVPVFNAPHSNTRSVAELVISEIIALSRKLGDLSRDAHQGVWKKSALGSYEVRGKVLGIVGYGHIGSQVSILAENLGMNVVFFDVEKKLPLGNSKVSLTLKNLLSVSDFVTLHVPDTVETRMMIDKTNLDLMKPGSFILNLSRGTVVDLNALAERINSGHIAGAAVDVFPVEPESNKEKFSSPLQGVANVLLTPHIGGSTEEAQEAIALEVSQSLIKYMTLGSTTGAVNFPQVSVPVFKKGYRLTNVHNNVPGVLGEINSIVSRRGVNISAQYLATDSEIGYLVMDLETTEIQGLEDEISDLNTSVKTRVIHPPVF